MSELHIYTAALQPATCFVDNNGPVPYTFRNKPYALARCGRCDNRHRCENMVAQVYYDHIAYWCAPGKGCKSEAFAEAKRRREFRNRSRAQRKRFAAAPSQADRGEK